MAKLPSGLLRIRAFGSLRLKQFVGAGVIHIARMAHSIVGSQVHCFAYALLLYLAAPICVSAAPLAKANSIAIQSKLGFTVQEVALINSLGPWPVKKIGRASCRERV